MHNQRHLWLCIKKTISSTQHNAELDFKKIWISEYKSLYALYKKNVFFLFSDDDIPVAFDVTQLAAVEVHQQLPEAGVGWREVNLGLHFLARTHGRAQPAE